MCNQRLGSQGERAGFMSLNDPPAQAEQHEGKQFCAKKIFSNLL